jgi:hypothetical protein
MKNGLTLFTVFVILSAPTAMSVESGPPYCVVRSPSGEYMIDYVDVSLDLCQGLTPRLLTPRLNAKAFNAKDSMDAHQEEVGD